MSSAPARTRNYARMGASHPDHRAVGSAALDAVYPDARNPFAFPELREREGLAPWTVREVWLASSPSPTHFVDVTATFSRKIAALRAHESQTGHLNDLEERIRGWLSRGAALGGLPDGRLAESFQVLDTGLRQVLATGLRQVLDTGYGPIDTGSRQVLDTGLRQVLDTGYGPIDTGLRQVLDTGYGPIDTGLRQVLDTGYGPIDTGLRQVLDMGLRSKFGPKVRITG